MVIGGEDVFRAVLPQAGRIYLTEVHAAPDADTWFPALRLQPSGARSRASAHAAGPKDEHAFSFVVLERVADHDGLGALRRQWSTGL